MRRFRVLLDANVLVDAQVRDFFCHLAEAEFIEVRWTPAVLGETKRALEENLHLDSSATDRLLTTLQRAFPDAIVTGFEHLIGGLELPDPDDRHVLAGAIHGECDALVTFNIDDFPFEAAESHDLLVVSVDTMLKLIAGWFGDRLGAVIDAQLAPLRRPPVTVQEFLDRLARRAPLGASAIGVALGITSYVTTYQDILDVGDNSSPYAAVLALLDALREGRKDEVRKAIHPELARRLTAKSNPKPAAVFKALRRQLADALTDEGWGVATGKRLLGPSTEIVKLVRLPGNEPIRITKPTVVHGHLVQLVHDGSAWLITDINFPDPALAGVDPASLDDPPHQP